MKRKILATLLLGAAIAVAPALSLASEKLDIGKREYGASCAACHGVDGRGKGSFAELLPVKMPDLTALAKSNGGVFPIAYVYNVIDGRESFKAHGTREMPIWGKNLSYRAAPQYDDYAYDPDVFVRARILSVIDYLYRLQAK
jgi:mono/diheme cytochrome c family protein